MNSADIRQTFLDFFRNKGHQIVDSAPIVVKNDPTLMFTNAGMNQFKDYFLGNQTPDARRVADTQKCLRVSGKHNDLEEVGVDTYHHTMFEMLGNWSFGDYFKKEAIEWAWELLTDVYKIPKDRLYVTVFEGDPADGVPEDKEAYTFWSRLISPDRIILASKKDNFWEMGETGPCGPCSEIHVDIRPDAQRAKVDGKTLVNRDHPQVIEVWNLVFIQFNRNADGSLSPLPEKHVDTGMGFERLCMVLQGVQSNYDTDVFTPYIAAIAKITGHEYGKNGQADIAMRVIADHLRAIAFAINDGQLPSNTGAGYVIRRILRRAVRYAFSYLDYKKPILHQLVPVFVRQFVGVFPELDGNKAFIAKVMEEEEASFLRTLESGLKKFGVLEAELAQSGEKRIDGEAAFELYDTYGFPIDLTRLIASEKGLHVDEAGFEKAMQAQKDRARAASKTDAGDWTLLLPETETDFVGYHLLQTEARVVKYRKVTAKKKESFQMVLDSTPFYAESGGQVGDTGYLQFGEEKISVTDTKKENNLIIHFVNKLPADPSLACRAVVNAKRRKLTANNHTATHLLHAALRNKLGTHVQQKGSLVDPGYLRFDFSHFSKLSEEELAQVESEVNEKIMENITLKVLNDVPIGEALQLGAMALFGEKYGDKVRVVIFDPGYSVELCGGTHVAATGEIGFCKITVETSVAAGVRRIEAITGPAAYEHIAAGMKDLADIKQLFNNPKQAFDAVQKAVDENAALRKEIERMNMERAGAIKNQLKAQAESINGMNFLAQEVEVANADMVKKMAYDLRNELPSLFLVLGAEIDGKAHLTVMFSDELVKGKNLDAGKIIRDLAKHVQGGGGGQPFYATAGGRNPKGMAAALQQAKEMAEGI